jgi:outer membrane immunogenic protein
MRVNRQTGNWVYGLEFGWDWADMKGTRTHVVIPANSDSNKINWISTLTGRVGMTAGAAALLYAKAGFAIADENHIINFNGNPATSSVSTTRKGYVVGGGIEYALASNWSAKVEYNYLGFRKQNLEFRYLAGGLVEAWDIQQDAHIFKIGLNWRFAPLPVVARY